MLVSHLVLRLVGVSFLSLSRMSLCQILSRIIVVRLVASVCCLFVVFVGFAELVAVVVCLFRLV